MPTTIKKMIGALQKDEDYSFDSVPMPYDITINATNAGSKEVTYAVMPSPKRVDLTAEELEALEKRGDIDSFLAKLIERDSKKPEQSGYEKAKAVALKFTGSKGSK